ncbi:MAG: hypothetical protein EA384_03745 [Spirochaetaceae bacterium]|nr:MAG: hypothetical protein EA384_03745 [Spirochaetaceae bacterium]
MVGGQRVERAVGTGRNSSLIVLHRGGKYRRFELFDELQRSGFEDVLSLEPHSNTYDVEALSRQYGGVRFLIPHQRLSIGAQVNIGMQEALGKLVCVIWNDMELDRNGAATAVRLADETDALCIVPMMRSERGGTIPTIAAPAIHGGRLRILTLGPLHDGMPGLYPVDYVGLYRRKRFIGIGGYDPLISGSYWQKIDFGLRAHMWGEQIVYHGGLRLISHGGPEPENTTPDESYRRFYLKNLSVRFRGDQGCLPTSRFPAFFLKTGGGLFSSWALFRSVQQWVFDNRYRFVQDSRRVTELWEIDE